jgi:hypothetical protein
LFAVMQFSWGGKRPVISPTRKKAWKASRYIALISTFTKFDLHVYCSEPKDLNIESVIGNLVSLDDFNFAYPSNVSFIINSCVKSVTFCILW